ncbi:MAG: hypothetical protein SF097_05970 [Acidobacteriota bacterium]|nr:hypothetical protein [Acidobacteriota bacterium]
MAPTHFAFPQSGSFLSEQALNLAQQKNDTRKLTLTGEHPPGCSRC